jgi:hypothetical protein
LLLGLALQALAQEEPTCNVTFKVLKDYNGKALKNASVIMHPVNGQGKQSRGGYELKTDDNGVTSFPGIPYGLLRVQVLVQGFQTFGEDYNINKPELEIVIKMKRPAGQYTVYGDSKGDTAKEAPKDAPKDAPKPPDQKPQ